MDTGVSINMEVLFTKDNGIKTNKMALELNTSEMAPFMKVSLNSE